MACCSSVTEHDNYTRLALGRAGSRCANATPPLTFNYRDLAPGGKLLDVRKTVPYHVAQTSRYLIGQPTPRYLLADSVSWGHNAEITGKEGHDLTPCPGAACDAVDQDQHWAFAGAAVADPVPVKAYMLERISGRQRIGAPS